MPLEFEPGQDVLHGRYTLISRLGRGAQGQTFLAEDSETGQRVAVKTLHVKRAREWKAVDLFRRETEVLQRLAHPGIPAYIDAFDEKDGTEFYLVQALAEGQNLEVRLAHSEMFTAVRLEVIARRTLAILDYLHSQSPPVLHRDIKPSNLVLGPEDEVYLVDFGAVQNQGSRGTTIVGTTGYMPAEQLAGRATPASDLYALAATLVHLATRCHPSELPVSRMKLQWRSRARLPEAFSAWLDHLLEPDVESRPRNARAALLALDQADQLVAERAPQSLVLARAPERQIVLNTVQEKVDRVVLYRENGDLVVNDEGGHPSKGTLFLCVLGLPVILIGIFQMMGGFGIVVALIAALFMIGLIYTIYDRGRHPVYVRFSRQEGLILEKNGEVYTVPISEMEVAFLEDEGGNKTYTTPILRTKQKDERALTREMKRAGAQRVIHEVKVWLMENRL